MGCSLRSNELFHVAASDESGGSNSYVSFSPAPSCPALNRGDSLSGGTLMVIIGVLYLIFEKKLLARSGFPGDSTEPALNVLSRGLLGAQVSRQHENIKETGLTGTDRIYCSSYGCYEIKRAVPAGKIRASSRQPHSWLVYSG